MPHTPGPWHRNIAPASKYNVVFSGRNTHVARIVADGLPEDEIEANCDLVTAAPDMLAALKNLVDGAIASQRLDNEDPALVEAFRIADAAIAKAEGRRA